MFTKFLHILGQVSIHFHLWLLILILLLIQGIHKNLFEAGGVLGSSLTVQSGDIGNDTFFQFARLESTELEMV